MSTRDILLGACVCALSVALVAVVMTWPRSIICGVGIAGMAVSVAGLYRTTRS